MRYKEKDQTPCPKCGRLFCEGFWGEGVCVADMHFGYEPTAAGDAVAEYFRIWYEKNRESWWDRHRPGADVRGGHADEFILGLLNEVYRIQQARSAERLYEKKKK